jgi:hypothetical protein
MKQEWTKGEVNKSTVEMVDSWLAVKNFEDATDQLILRLVNYLVNSSMQFHTMQNIQFTVFPDQNRSVVGSLLRKAEVSGILNYKLVGLKRQRNWIAGTICFQNSFLYIE